MDQSSLYFYLIFFGALIIVFIGASVMLILFSMLDWGRSQIGKKDIEIYEDVNKLANELGIKNLSVPPQKNLNYFSWMVYNKKLSDHYLPFKNTIRKFRGESELKKKPDSLKSYYLSWFQQGLPNISNIIATEDNAEPYIMISNERVRVGKNNYEDHRLIYYKSAELDLPKCEVSPAIELLDNIIPDEDDINFISDEDFSKMFDLKGENEITIRTLFNKKIRTIITKNNEWNWKFDENQIMVSYELEKRGAVNDIKSSLGVLAQIHNELRSIDLADPLNAEEIAKDTPDEIIDKKLYRKRMATFGCSMGCGIISLYLGLIFLWETILRRQLDMVFPSLFWSIPGFIALRFGYLEWKRNRQLKKDGKVKEGLND